MAVRTCLGSTTRIIGEPDSRFKTPVLAWPNLLEGNARAVAYLSAFEFGRFMIDSKPETFDEVKECFRIYMNRMDAVMEARP